MNIILCDDCKKDMDYLHSLLDEYENKQKEKFTITEFSSGQELCHAKEALDNCAIVFLDINMEKQDGLKTAAQLKALYPEILIVLVTAYMGYALEGYKVKASRFLLKDDLEHTLGECMDSLLDELHRKKRYVEFSFVEGERRLLVDEIFYIETSRHKNMFYTKKQTYTIYKKLDELELELSQYGFVRVHQSFLVNMRYIDKISSYVLRLITGKEISVPKARYQEVKRSFALYKGAV
ncbi:MAG: response regulator transcription factor [Lachnospiraceae bacterium]|nr:response regulator transcription factor [Lachnospiraceae bacterium]